MDMNARNNVGKEKEVVGKRTKTKENKVILRFPLGTNGWPFTGVLLLAQETLKYHILAQGGNNRKSASVLRNALSMGVRMCILRFFGNYFCGFGCFLNVLLRIITILLAESQNQPERTIAPTNEPTCWLVSLVKKCAVSKMQFLLGEHACACILVPFYNRPSKTHTLLLCLLPVSWI